MVKPEIVASLDEKVLETEHLLGFLTDKISEIRNIINDLKEEAKQ
jgi:hypothetical protein